MIPVDVESVICRALIEQGVAGGNVFVATGTRIIETMPVVFVTQTSLMGRPADGFFEATVAVDCIARDEYAAGVTADTVLTVLDGFGGYGIADATHIGTYRRSTSETTPATHTYAMTFRVLFLNLKK